MGFGARAPGARDPDVCSPRCALCAQGLKARDLIHARIEENIRAKIRRLRAADAGGGCKDALQLLIEHSWERGERLDMQVSRSFRSGTAEFDPLASQKQFLGSPKCPQRGPGSQNEKPSQTPGTGPRG